MIPITPTSNKSIQLSTQLLGITYTPFYNLMIEIVSLIFIHLPHTKLSLILVMRIFFKRSCFINDGSSYGVMYLYNSF